MKDEPIQQGRQLTHFGTKSGMADLFSLGDHNRLVDACTSFLNLQIVEGDSFKFTATPNNSTITIPRQSSAAQSLSSLLPWQIRKISPTGADADWRTVTVNHGAAWLFNPYRRRGVLGAQQPDMTFTPGATSIINSTGTGTNIVVAAGEIWSFWIKIELDTQYVAELGSGLTPPSSSLWPEWPHKQAMDEAAVRGDGNAYAMIGFVDASNTTDQQLVIQQFVYGNIEIPYIGEEEMGIIGTTWSILSYYPLNSLLSIGGQLYFRHAIANGESGGDPTGGNDWTPIP